MPQDDAASKPLPPRREAFIREYLKDLNATQAAVRAGYAASTANREGARLLSDAVISARIAQAQGQRAERAALDAQTVLEGLLSEARGEGPDTNSSGRIRAWELVGKHLGMWKEARDDGKRSGLDDLITTMAALRAERQGEG